MRDGVRLQVRQGVMVAVGVSLALMSLAGVNTQYAIRNTQSDAVVRAGRGSIAPGTTTTLPVEVSGVQDLGAATVMVAYDPALLAVAGCQTNRAFDTGMCNPEYDRDADGTADGVRFTVLSLEGLSVADGEPLDLAGITWTASDQPPPGTIIPLEVDVLNFSDTHANPIDVSVEHGEITVVAEPASTPTPTPTVTPAAAWKVYLSFLAADSGE